MRAWLLAAIIVPVEKLSVSGDDGANMETVVVEPEGGEKRLIW
jgi:hypothetical protein